MANVFTQSQQQQLASICQNNPNASDCLGFLSSFGLSDKHDCNSLINLYTKSRDEFLQQYLNNAPPTIIVAIIGNRNDSTSFALALDRVLPPVVTAKTQANSVVIKSIEVDTRAAPFMPIGVQANELRAIETNREIPLSPAKAMFSAETRTLMFASGRETAQIMINALRSSIINTKIQTQFAALVESSCQPEGYTPGIAASEMYTKMLTRNLTLAGFAQQGSILFKEVIDNLSQILNNNTAKVKLGIGSGRPLVDSPIFVFLPPGALNMISFGDGIRWKDGGFSSSDTQDFGSDSFYFAGVRFVEIPGVAGLDIKRMITNYTYRGEFAVTGKSPTRGSAADIVNETALCWRSLEGVETSIGFVPLEDLFKNVMQFSESTPSNPDNTPITFLNSSLQDIAEKAAKLYNIAVPTNGDLRGEFAPDVMMTPTTVDPGTKRPRVIATPALGAVAEVFTNAEFMRSAANAASLRLREHMKAIPNGETYMANLNTMFDYMIRSNNPGNISNNSPNEKFMTALSAVGINKFGVHSLPPVTAAGEINNIVFPKGQLFPATGSIGWCYYFANIYAQGASTTDERNWEKWYGDAFMPMMKVYYDGIRALETCLNIAVQNLYGDFNNGTTPAFSEDGAFLGSFLGGTDELNMMIRAFTALCAPEIGTTVSIFVSEADSRSVPADADIGNRMEKLVGPSYNAALVSLAKAAFQPNVEASSLRGFILKDFEVSDQCTTADRQEIIKALMDGNENTATEQAKYANLLSKAVHYFSNHGIMCGAPLQTVPAIKNTPSTEVAIENNQSKDFKRTAMCLTSDALLGDDAAKTTALKFRPGKPGSQLDVMNIINADDYYDALKNYGKKVLYMNLPMQADRSVAMSARDINRQFSWSRHGFLLASGYDKLRRSLAFNRNMISALNAVSGGQLSGRVTSSNFDRMGAVLYLSTVPTGSSLSRLARNGVPVPFRVLVSWPQIMTTNQMVIAAKGNIGVTPVTNATWKGYKSNSNEIYTVSADFFIGSGVAYSNGCKIIRDGIITDIAGDRGMKRCRDDGSDGAVFFLIGQTSPEPRGPISLCGNVINSEHVDPDLPLTKPSFDAGILAAALLAFSRNMNGITNLKLNYKTITNGDVEGWIRHLTHAAHDLRSAPQYRKNGAGGFTLVSRGNSTLSCFGPGVTTQHIRRISEDK